MNKTQSNICVPQSIALMWYYDNLLINRYAQIQWQEILWTYTFIITWHKIILLPVPLCGSKQPYQLKQLAVFKCKWFIESLHRCQNLDYAISEKINKKSKDTSRDPSHTTDCWRGHQWINCLKVTTTSYDSNTKCLSYEHLSMPMYWSFKLNLNDAAMNNINAPLLSKAQNDNITVLSTDHINSSKHTIYASSLLDVVSPEQTSRHHFHSLIHKLPITW